MKKHEITTSKGEFVVVESDESLVTRNTPKLFDFQTNIHVIDGIKHECICKLSEATEEDAKGVVGNIHLDNNDYLSSKAYLQLLIQSRGIDVNNGNWYLFKKLK